MLPSEERRGNASCSIFTVIDVKIGKPHFQNLSLKRYPAILPYLTMFFQNTTTRSMYFIIRKNCWTRGLLSLPELQNQYHLSSSIQPRAPSISHITFILYYFTRHYVEYSFYQGTSNHCHDHSLLKRFVKETEYSELFHPCGGAA